MQNRQQNENVPVAQVDIGALLAEQRESKGVSAKEAAKMVNLSANIIDDLENNRFSKIGTTVYVRGYLGLYAKYLGLDAAQIINLYDTQYPAEPIAIRPTLSQSVNGRRRQTRRHSKTLSLLVATIVFAGLAYGYYRLEPLFFSSASIEPDANTDTPAVVLETDEPSPVTAIISETEGVQNLADDALQGLPISNPEDALISDLELTSIGSDEPMDTAGAGDSESLNGLAIDLAVSSDNEISNTDETSSVITNDSTPLKMAFKDDCWLKVTDANDNVLVVGTYSTRRSVDVVGKPPFKVRTSRAYAVKSIMMGDKSMKLGDYRINNQLYELK